MHEILPKLTLRDALGYLLAYACWVLAILASMVALFYARDAFNLAWAFTGGSVRLLRAVDKFLLLLLGAVWICYGLIAEYQYRHSIDMARARRASAQAPDRRRNRGARLLRNLGLDLLGQRFLITMAFPVGLLLLSYLSRWLPRIF